MFLEVGSVVRFSSANGAVIAQWIQLNITPNFTDIIRGVLSSVTKK